MLVVEEDRDLFWSDMNPFVDLDVNRVNKYFDPRCRSSTIFPVYKVDGGRCHLSFLTYWLKKHDSKVAIRLTARDVLGGGCRPGMEADNKLFRF
jgi:hypothetical protein